MARDRRGVWLVTATPARAVVCGGGGSSKSDCLLVFDGPLNELKLTCDPPVSCDPQVLFAGTFDRIQRQIFSRSCALSGRHDSQTQAGNMLLESGGCYSNIVNVVPSNLVAARRTTGVLDERHFDTVAGAIARLCASHAVDPNRLRLPARRPHDRGTAAR